MIKCFSFASATIQQEQFYHCLSE